MFKKIIILVSLVMLMIPVMSACNKYSGEYMKDPESLSSAAVLRMRKDYLKMIKPPLPQGLEYKLKDIWVQKHFGTFSGCEVVYMGSCLGYTNAECPVEIAGYMIVFPNSKEVYAYKDSKFYTLKEAYNAGLITKEDVYEIGKQVGIGFADEYPTP